VCGVRNLVGDGFEELLVGEAALGDDGFGELCLAARVAVRAQDHLARPGGDEYNNSVVAFLELRWGKLISWEDYEDTERIAAWDAARSMVSS
jgi:hypothetical protein